jgi:undecaprenyl diphosphate synthase
MDNALPQCVGIILDGNRRWAKSKGLPKLEGHRKGFERLIDAARWVRDRGVPHLVVFAFSTENWNREAEEVSYLMDLLREMAKKQLRELEKEGVRLRFIGTRERLAPDIRDAIEEAETASANNSRLTLWVCLSYGARAEIVAAAEALRRAGTPITEETLRSHLWSAEMPDPDIIIRTSGEKRLSNFLLWQAAYSELFFVESHWPDFSEEMLDGVLRDYAERERRHGK